MSGEVCRCCKNRSVFKDFELPISYCIVCADSELKIGHYLLQQRVYELEAQMLAMKTQLDLIRSKVVST